MKPIKIALSVLLIAVLMAGVLSGCAVKQLKGTYKSTDSIGGSLTFEEEQKVTGELFGITLEGTYEIKDDTITFKYSGPLGIGATLDKSFRKDGSSIWIDETEFIKEK